MHPVANFVIAKTLERAAPEQLIYALGELRDSLSKLRRKLTYHLAVCGVLDCTRNSDWGTSRFD
jgi:hypothetical protein